jgi:hypothetical protein
MRWPVFNRSKCNRRPSLSRPQNFDRLEERTLLAGNIVDVGEDDTSLQQFTQSGQLVSSGQIPQPPTWEEFQLGRGVTVDSLGRLELIDGTLQPHLYTYTPSTQSWSYQTFAGWQYFANETYGTVGSLGPYVYVSNQGPAGGIIRFDTTGGPTASFAAGESFEQLTVGQDGLIYGLGSDSAGHQVAYGYDPSTFALVRSVVLSIPSASTDYTRSIAVDSAGDILAAAFYDGKVYKLDPSGKTIEAQVQLLDGFLHPVKLVSIALDTDGQIAAGSDMNDIFLTDESLSSAKRMIRSVVVQEEAVFVTFDHYINVTPPGAPNFSALAAPTINYGTATTTLSGLISDSGGIPSGNVDITLNGVTEPAAINPSTGAFSAVFDTSKLGVSSSPYAITYNYSGSAGVPPVAVTSRSLTVAPRALTITANDATKTYGNTDPSFSASYSGFATGETASNLTGTLALKTNEPAGNAPAGRYTVTPSGLSSPNYAITFDPGTLTVTPRALTATAGDASRTYGDSDPSFRASYNGFVPGEDASVLSGALSFTTNEPAGNAPVGNYAVTPGGLSSGNYSLTFVAGTLGVTPRALTITANDESKTYGDADPVLSASFSGYASGDDSSVLGGTLAFVTNEPSGNAPVGTYTITPGGLTSANYAISFASGVLAVTPRVLTITADDASRVYGQDNSSFDATYSGFVPGEGAGDLGGQLGLDTTAIASSDVGDYPIVPSGLTSTNYAITFANGMLSVTPAPLTVTANNLTIRRDAPMPALTYTIRGFVNGDTSAVVTGMPALSTQATSSSATGTYPITVSAGSLAAKDYAFTQFVPGALTVNPSAVPGDYDGDGRTDVGLYNAAAGMFVVAPSHGGAAIVIKGFGGPSAMPLGTPPSAIGAISAQAAAVRTTGVQAPAVRAQSVQTSADLGRRARMFAAARRSVALPSGASATKWRNG